MYRDEFRQGQREFYWSVPRIFVAILAVMLVTYIVGFIATGGDLAIYRFWAPKQEAARRQVYEQTKSYRQGSIQRLNTLCAQIDAADSDHKVMLRDTVSQEFAEWSMADVPDYLRGCIRAARLQ